MSLAIQNRVVVLRSTDGTGSNNSKTFEVNWTNILGTTYSNWLLSSKFLSTTGDFSGNSAEVRFDISVSNQNDTIVDKEVLCFPLIYQDIDGDGVLVGSSMSCQFSESVKVYLPTPTRSSITIPVHDLNGTLIGNMPSWVLVLQFEPVVRRTTTTR